jgi:hypothetical protein
MNGLRPRDSCRGTFRDWEILPLQYQYIFSLLMFVVNSMGLCYTTSQIHGLNARCKFDLYHPQATLNNIPERTLLFWYNIFYHLPLNIKELAHNIKQFRVALDCLLTF